MLGQAVRRFATSAVRSSHYAEGPGKVRSSLWRSYVQSGLLFVSGLVFSHMLTVASFNLEVMPVILLDHDYMK